MRSSVLSTEKRRYMQPTAGGNTHMLVCTQNREAKANPRRQQHRKGAQDEPRAALKFHQGRAALTASLSTAPGPRDPEYEPVTTGSVSDPVVDGLHLCHITILTPLMYSMETY